MCPPRYRRLPDDVYRTRYGDPSGEILPPFWLGGCVLCLWVAIGAAVVVTIVAWDLLLGLGVGLGGAVLGIVTTTLLAVGFPGLDARWLRLGPLAVAVECGVLFLGAVLVVLLALAALLGQPVEAPAPPPIPAAASRGADAFGVVRTGWRRSSSLAS